MQTVCASWFWHATAWVSVRWAFSDAGAPMAWSQGCSFGDPFEGFLGEYLWVLHWQGEGGGLMAG